MGCHQAQSAHCGSMSEHNFLSEKFRVQMLGDLAKCSLNCELKGLAVHLGDDVLNKGCLKVGVVNFCHALAFPRLPVASCCSSVLPFYICIRLWRDCQPANV